MSETDSDVYDRRTLPKLKCVANAAVSQLFLEIFFKVLVFIITVPFGLILIAYIK